MSRELKSLSQRVNIQLLDLKGGYFLCPDGNSRRLMLYEIADDYATLHFNPVQEGTQTLTVRWRTADVSYEMTRYTRISQQQAQGHTALSVAVTQPATQETVTPLELPQLQVMRMIDPSNSLNVVSDGLMDAFAKLKNSPSFIPQAQAMNEIAKSVIDIAKTRAATLKLAIEAQGRT